MAALDIGAIEKKWQKKWEEDKLYDFDENSKKTKYIIDTPPPYPTGRMHMGHTLNWVYMDIVARYMRMKGREVMFPQGWDCHGLPTEVKVEETHKIKKNDVPKQKFRKMCIELTTKNIERMKAQMKSLGLSISWNREYITMLPEYFGKTQLSFVQLYNKGLLYRAEHPVNWCPRCETAIAFAEVEYKDRTTKLNYLYFPMGERKLEIATTRPELLGACVAIAVNPDDERFRDLVGKKAEVPLFGRFVEILADKEVDPEFGTGVVMICTFGDKTDVLWAKRYSLPVIKLIDEQGKLTEQAGRYAGMNTKEAQEKITADLKKEGYLYKQESLPQSVGACWRCKSPLEIIASYQWFLNVRKYKEDVKKTADDIRWVPEHMKIRLLNWTDSMEWDWCISRQRIFATPFPVWYCDKCGEVVVASEKDIPVNPLTDKCPVKKCSKCGETRFRPEEDVMDTWMDSSITPLSISEWPKTNAKLFPTTLRPQGHDIIRTWAYYTIVRSLMLTGKKPWDEILINGMVQGEDGRKMSKSLGNVVEPDKAIDEYGADAVRQWCGNTSPGSDVPFSWKEVKHGNAFIKKLYNACRFAGLHLKDFDGKPPKEFRKLEKGMLSKLNSLVLSTTSYLDDYLFGPALDGVRVFFWHEFCDNYIELVKHVLYEGKDEDEKRSVKFALQQIVWGCLKMLAPFMPHITEELFSGYSKATIHKEKWPGVRKELISKDEDNTYEVVTEIISEVRKEKNTKKMALNSEFEELHIFSIYAKDLKGLVEDIKGTTKAKKVSVSEGKERFELQLKW